MFRAAGVLVVEILASDALNAGGAASRMNLDSWITTYRLNVTAVRDPSGTPTLMAYGRREYTFIVALSTMRIVERIDGSVAGVGDSSIRTALAHVLALPPAP